MLVASGDWVLLEHSLESANLSQCAYSTAMLYSISQHVLLEDLPGLVHQINLHHLNSFFSSPLTHIYKPHLFGKILGLESRAQLISKTISLRVNECAHGLGL